MSYELTTPRPVACPECAAQFDFELRLGFDARVRPDLLRAIAQRRLYALTCPTCEAELGELDGMALILNLGPALPVVFMPSQTTPANENRQLLTQLALDARGKLGDAFPDPDFEHMQMVPKWLMVAALRLVREEDTGSLDRIAAILRFLVEDRPAERRALLEAAPQLLDDETDRALLAIHAAAAADGDPPDDVRSDLDRLRRIRAEGVDAVLHDDADAALAELEALAGEGDFTRRIDVARQAIALLGAEEGGIGASLTMEKLHDYLALMLTEAPAGGRAQDRDSAVDEAISLLERRIADPDGLIQREVLPERWAMRRALLAMAWLARGTGEPAHNVQRGMALLGEAAEEITRDRDAVGWASLQSQMAEAIIRACALARDTTRIDAASDHLDAARSVFTRKDHPRGWAHTLLLEGRIELIRGATGVARDARIGRAIRRFEEVLAVTDPVVDAGIRADCEIRIAHGLLQRADRARHHVDEAIERIDRVAGRLSRAAAPSEWAELQHRLGSALAERGADGDDARAITCLEDALTVRTPTRLPHAHMQTATALADLQFRRGEWPAAHEAYASAAQAGETLFANASGEIERHRRAEALSLPYGNGAWCALMLGLTTEAFERLERARTRVLGQALAIGDADVSILPPEERAAFERERDAVLQLEAELRRPTGRRGTQTDADLTDKLRARRRTLARAIHGALVAHPDLMGPQTRLDARLAALPDRSALVAFLVTSAGTAAFVVPGGATTVGDEHVVRVDGFTMARLHDLLTGPDGWLAGYRVRAESGDGTTWQATVERIGRVLWDELMAPIATRLRELAVSRAFLVPHRLLGVLPLHAAWREEAGEARYFSDDIVVSWSPDLATIGTSARRLARRRGTPQDTVEPSLLALVDPSRTLPFAAPECTAIARLFGSDRTQTMTGAGAAQNAFVVAAAGRTHVHFACHGRYDGSDVMQSGLMLADGDPLTLAEVVSDLDLERSHLVTLAACESGLTDLVGAPGEHIGLPAGFLQAGAPGVVSTLWPVDDCAAAMLMIEFYRRLLSDGEQPAMALAGAQRWLRGRTRDDVLQWLADIRPDAEPWAVPVLDDAGGWYEESEERPFVSPAWWAAFVASP